jgi:hypothetical protein
VPSHQSQLPKLSGKKEPLLLCLLAHTQNNERLGATARQRTFSMYARAREYHYQTVTTVAPNRVLNTKFELAALLALDNRYPQNAPQCQSEPNCPSYSDSYSGVLNNATKPIANDDVQQIISFQEDRRQCRSIQSTIACTK